MEANQESTSSPTPPVPGLDLWEPKKYDKLRRQLIPSFDLLYNSAVEAVAMTVPDRPRILDLGAGTGLLSEFMHRRLPSAELLLVDRSDSMLEQAIQRFRGEQSISTRTGDLLDPLPEGPYHAVISALAIHHLPHEQKRELFGRIYRVLRPQGIFVNVEQVLAPSSLLEEMYDVQHEKHVLDSRTPPEEWAAGRERMKYDICADTESQIGWLREAGFRQVDCLAKDWRFATYAGWKEGA